MTPAEEALAAEAARIAAAPGPDVVSAVDRGDDPLGAEFCALRGPKRRRVDGATLTPSAVVAAMVDVSGRMIDPARIVDAGAGTGRYTISAARRFPAARIVAIERDGLASRLLGANILLSGLQDRVTIRVEDYRRTTLPRIEGRTLFIGNPPYLRHHKIEPEWKDWYKHSMGRYGIKASGLAGLHLYFFMKTLELAKPGDIGCLITAAEWLDVNYGDALRRLLLGPLGLLSLDIIDPAVSAFDDALTSAVITTFEVGRRVDSVQVRWHTDAAFAHSLGTGSPISAQRLASAGKWMPIVRPGGGAEAVGPTVGDLFRVQRGQVTGSNGIWVVDAGRVDLPDRVLLPSVTRAREIFDSNGCLTDAGSLRRVIDIPHDWQDFPSCERRAVRRFIDRALAMGGAESYIARHRTPWYSVRMPPPAPILCTYMARRPPRFVLNECHARHLNIAHGLYPLRPVPHHAMLRIVSYLSEYVDIGLGRTYAGGLTKFEPKEVERLPLPRDLLADFGPP